MKQLLLTIFLVFIPLMPSYSQDLLDIYKLALANDPDYKITDFNRQATIEIKSQNIAQMLPNIGVNIQSGRVHFDAQKTYYLGQGGQLYWEHSFGLDINQPVFNWSHWIQLEQSDLKIAQAQAEQQASYQALITRTVSTYFKVLAAHDMLEFSRAEKTAIERQLARTKARYQAGLSIMPDVYEAQAGYDRSLASEIEAQKQLDDALEQLRQITGATTLELCPLLPAIPLKQPDPENLLSWANHAETYNFAVVAQFNKTKLAQKNIEWQQSKHLPTIDLTAQFQIVDSNNPFGFRGDAFGFGLQLNIPLFEGGATESHARQAHYEYETAKEELITIKRSVDHTLKDAYRSVLANINKANALQATTQSAELAVRAAETGLNAGLRTMVDVLNEQRDLYKAKSAYAQSRYDYLISAIKLKEAMGTLGEEDVAQLNSYLAR